MYMRFLIPSFLIFEGTSLGSLWKPKRGEFEYCLKSSSDSSASGFLATHASYLAYRLLVTVWGKFTSALSSNSGLISPMPYKSGLPIGHSSTLFEWIWYTFYKVVTSLRCSRMCLRFLSETKSLLSFTARQTDSASWAHLRRFMHLRVAGKCIANVRIRYRSLQQPSRNLRLSSIGL